jgi:hypothetical protein
MPLQHVEDAPHDLPDDGEGHHVPRGEKPDEERTDCAQQRAEKRHGQRLRDGAVDVGVLPIRHVLPHDEGAKKRPDPLGRVQKPAEVEVPHRGDDIDEGGDKPAPAADLAAHASERAWVTLLDRGDLVGTDGVDGGHAHWKFSRPI